MKNTIFPIVIAGLLLTSCSSAYRTGQTPDDVYFSTSPVVPAELTRNTSPKDDYQSYWADPDDDYLRMKVQRGGRWNTIDDLDYWYGYGSNTWGMNNRMWMLNTNPYSLGYQPWNWSGIGSLYGYNSWSYSNAFYGGGYGGYYANYYPVAITKNPSIYSNPSRPSLRGYGNTLYGNANSNNGRRMGSSSSNSGNYRTIFGGGSNSGNSNSNSSYDRPTRTFTPSSGSPSSSGSSRSSGSSSSGSSSSGSSRGGRGG